MEKVSVMNTQTEAAVYARLSVEKESNETIQTQVEMLRQYMRANPEFDWLTLILTMDIAGQILNVPDLLS